MKLHREITLRVHLSDENLTAFFNSIACLKSIF